MTQHQTIIADLAHLLGEKAVTQAPDVLSKHGVDGGLPKAVLYPGNTRQVAEILRYANAKDLAVTPWGSGSKMGTGSPPRRLDLVVSMGRMNHMLDVDAANLTLTVEAGVRFVDAQARLGTEDNRCYLPLDDLAGQGDGLICSERSHSGCFVPLDPAFGRKATIGGILATNATGPRRLLYGLPRDVVLGVRFVSPEGEIIGAGGKTVKNVSSYDLSKLMIGAYGSLGILCEMTLRLLPLPERMETLLVGFDSLDKAERYVQAVLGTKLLPAALDVVDGGALQACGGAVPAVGALEGAAYVVLLALEAFEEAVERMHRELLVMAGHMNVLGQGEVLGDHGMFWLDIGELEGKLHARHPEGVSLALSYPLSQWRSVLDAASGATAAQGLGMSFQCHAGSGVSHVHVFSKGGQGQGDRGPFIRCLDALLSRVRALGGSWVVTRAPLDLKPEIPVWGAEALEGRIMERLRREIDPKGIMNPGRFLVGP